jgi:predicted ATPase
LTGNLDFDKKARMKKYVISGGPNSGKTALLLELEQKGFAVLPETSRIVISQEQRKEQENPNYKVIFPWDNQEKFCKLFHQVQLKREKTLTGDIVFLDRSLVDPIAFAEIDGVKIDELVYEDIREANYNKIFIPDMLPGYKTDEQRKESPEKARLVHEKLFQVYDRLGFDILRVPVF